MPLINELRSEYAEKLKTGIQYSGILLDEEEKGAIKLECDMKTDISVGYNHDMLIFRWKSEKWEGEVRKGEEKRKEESIVMTEVQLPPGEVYEFHNPYCYDCRSDPFFEQDGTPYCPICG